MNCSNNAANKCSHLLLLTHLLKYENVVQQAKSWTDSGICASEHKRIFLWSQLRAFGQRFLTASNCINFSASANNCEHCSDNFAVIPGFILSGIQIRRQCQFAMHFGSTAYPKINSNLYCSHILDMGAVLKPNVAILWISMSWLSADGKITPVIINRRSKPKGVKKIRNSEETFDNLQSQ